MILPPLMAGWIYLNFSSGNQPFTFYVSLFLWVMYYSFFFGCSIMMVKRERERRLATFSLNVCGQLQPTLLQWEDCVEVDTYTPENELVFKYIALIING